MLIIPRGTGKQFNNIILTVQTFWCHQISLRNTNKNEWHKITTNKKDKNHPRLLAQTTLRNILGTKNLHEILSDRESISADMQVPALVNIISCDFFALFLFLEIYISGGVGRGNGAVGHQSGAS